VRHFKFAHVVFDYMSIVLFMASWAQFARGRGTPAENYWYTL